MNATPPRQHGTGLPLWPMIVALLSLGSLAGCRGVPQEKIDPVVQQEAKSGQVAMQEDLPELAVEHYKLAVKRAWALDDPEEIARNSYNLAAALFREECYEEARDWLLESREEFHQAGQPASVVWLLEAKIARKQDRYDDALCYADYVVTESQTDWSDCCEMLCCPVQQTTNKVQGGFNVFKNKKSAERKVMTSEAHLVQANVAIDLGQLDAAREHLAIATQNEACCCNSDIGIQAGIAHVNGRLSLYEGCPLNAGNWFWTEAALRRKIKAYHELQNALEEAAKAYAAAGEFPMAITCYYRLARINYGRDRLECALQWIQHALEMLQGCENPSLSQRVALLFREVNAAHQAALQERAKRAPSKMPSAPINPLAPHLPAPYPLPEPAPLEEIPPTPIFPSPERLQEVPPAIPIEQAAPPEQLKEQASPEELEEQANPEQEQSQSGGWRKARHPIAAAPEIPLAGPSLPELTE